MNRQIIFFLGFMLCFFESLWASALDSKLEFNSPIQWQQLRLQQSIEEKLSRSFAPVLSEKDYIIEVKIELDPNYSAPTTPKKISKGKQGKKIKYSTTEKTNDDGDYVVFSKFGLEAPAIGEEEIYTETSEAETTQKAIIEVSNHFNIFNYLRGIEITLTFDTNLSATTKEVLKKIVSGLRFNYNNVIPQINIRYLELKPVIKPVLPPQPNKANEEKKFNLSELLKFNNIDIALSLILATIIFAFVLLYVNKSKKTKSAESSGLPASNSNPQDSSDTIASGENKNSTSSSSPNKPKEDDKLKNGIGSSAGSQKNNSAEDEEMKREEFKKKTEESLERFRKALNNHFDQTIITLKKIIKSNKEADGLALKTLTDTLTDQELTKIFQHLSLEERNTWKTYLDHELDVEHAVKALNYISARLMEAMMLPMVINDIEIFDFLVGVPPKDAAAICQEDIELATILTNMVSTDIASEMFKLIPEPTLSTIIQKSLVFSPEDLNRKMPLLKEKISLLKKKNEKPPFIIKVIEMLPNAQQDIEAKLYQTLLAYYQLDEINKIAFQNYPKSLLLQLPEKVFQFVLTKLSLENQVKYFVTLDSDVRKTRLEWVAPHGSKAREMLDIEIETIVNNAANCAKFKKEHSKNIEAEFIKISREVIAGHEELQNEVLEQLSLWLQQHGSTLSNNETVST